MEESGMENQPMNAPFTELARQAVFGTERMGKVTVAQGEHLFAGLNCLEPGQSHRIHTHDGADKLYLVLSGKARMTVGAATREAEPGTLVWAPAGVPHGIEEALERTVLLVVMAPVPR
jgi:quercetin dioxygenase-like cupin family protein